MALSDTQVKILTLVEQRFWETGGIATNESIATDLKISVQTVRNAWKNESFRHALAARGVDLDPNASAGILTPEQVVVANMMMNLHDKRSVREKLQMVNVSSQQYHAWMRQPAFSNYLKMRAEKAFAGSDHLAYKAFINAMEEGDVNAATKYMEIRGIYNPKLNVEINVELLVVQLIEIVQRHVQDPVILQRIADDLERIEGLSSPAALPVGAVQVLSPGNETIGI